MSIGQLQELLQKHVIFSILDDDERSTLIQQMERVSFAMGETIVQEGELGDCAYLLSAGKARVFRQGATGKPVTLGMLSRGDLFGERSIITKEPRIASIRASEDVEAFRIRHEDFEKLLANNAELRPYFDKFLQEIAIVNFLRLKTCIGVLPPKQMLSLLDKFEEVMFQKDETIIAEGISNQRLYIIREGEVKVVKKLDGVETILAYVREGDYFGERSMLRNDMPIATVIATQETTCLALAYEYLKPLLDSSPSLQAQFIRRIEQYSDEAFQLPTSEPFSPPSLPLTTAHTEETAPDDTQPRRRRWFRRHPWIRQHDETDCGAACLAMVSRAYGVRLPVGRARDLIRVGREGISMYNIAAGAETIGFMSRAVNADYGSAATLELPAIAHWKGYHYIVLYEIKPAYVMVGDPAIGILRLSRQDFEAGWTGRLLLLTPTSSLEDVEPEKNPLKRFLPLLKPYKVLLLEVLLASLLLELFTLAIPIFTQTIVDKVLVHNNIPMLNIMLGGMVIVGIFRAITSLLRQYLLIHVSTKLGLRMAADLFQQIMRLPLGYFRTRKIGDLLTRFSDNAKVRQLITGASVTTMLDALMIGVYIGLMVYYNVKLAALVTIFMVMFAGILLFFTPALKRTNQQIFAKQSLSQSHLVESIEGIETIKSSTAELPSRWHFENLIVQQANAVFQSATLLMSMTSFSSSLQMFATMVLLWYGAHLVLQGELTVGQLVAFQSLLGMILTPVIGVVGLWQTLQDAFLSLERLNDIYDAEPEEKFSSHLIHLPPVRGRITFEHVSFRYNPDDKNILANVSFDVLPGQTCAIVGRSGSGKTTLISLLQRFYVPTEGRILIDGYDLISVSLESLRAQIGIVLQESKLFTGTIRENISTADPDAPLDRVIAAAQLANAHDFIMSFPLSYNTMIGEVGVKLSGGQKQRICIARALLQEPRIVIFDEATSSLDSESERAIQENMHTILKDRTALVIAHRLSTVRYADVILVLDNGVIVERGNHEELMELRGLYYYLNSQQLSV